MLYVPAEHARSEAEPKWKSNKFVHFALKGKPEIFHVRRIDVYMKVSML